LYYKKGLEASAAMEFENLIMNHETSNAVKRKRSADNIYTKGFIEENLNYITKPKFGLFDYHNYSAIEIDLTNNRDDEILEEHEDAIKETGEDYLERIEEEFQKIQMGESRRIDDYKTTDADIFGENKNENELEQNVGLLGAKSGVLNERSQIFSIYSY